MTSLRSSTRSVRSRSRVSVVDVHNWPGRISLVLGDVDRSEVAVGDILRFLVASPEPAIGDGRVRFESVRAAVETRDRMSRTRPSLRPWVGAADGAAQDEENEHGFHRATAIVRFRFHDGDVEEFKRLSVQCMEIVRTQDTGTLQYDTYFNDDETECIVIERFRDSDALIQHGENLAHLIDAIVATGSVSGELLGEPSTELRARFTGGGPVQLFTPWATI